MSAAKRGAKRLLGCYRTGDANDPETYIAAVVSVLSRYSESIIAEVTEPATGLPSTSKWLPSVFELREECDRREARERRIEEFRRTAEEQIAARPKLISAATGG